MNKDNAFYEKKIRELHQENDQLRNSLRHSRRRLQTQPDTIYQIKNRNEKLERQAYKYQQRIKEDLSRYLVDSSIQSQCLYRNRYGRLLNSRRTYYQTYF